MVASPELEQVRKLVPRSDESVQQSASRSAGGLSPARVVCGLAFMAGLVFGGALAEADLVSWLRREAVSTEIEGPAAARSTSAALPAGRERTSSGVADRSALPAPDDPETALAVAVATAAPSAPPGKVGATATIPEALSDPPAPAEAAAPGSGASSTAVIEFADEFRIQLAALDREASADAMWDAFVAEFEPLVKDLERYVVKMKGASGTLYLLQVGPFHEMQQALARCDALHRQDAGCVVVRRLRQARAPASG